MAGEGSPMIPGRKKSKVEQSLIDELLTGNVRRDPADHTDHKNEPSDPYAGWYRRPGTISPEDPGRAFYPQSKHELTQEEFNWHLDHMIANGVDAHKPADRQADKPAGMVTARRLPFDGEGSWAGRGYDLQTREGQLHHRVEQNLMFGEIHPLIGPWAPHHKPGVCDQSRRAKGSPHSHVDGLEAPADYWWLGPNGYWQALCSRCVLVDMAVAVENPDLGPIVILPAVHRV